MFRSHVGLAATVSGSTMLDGGKSMDVGQSPLRRMSRWRRRGQRAKMEPKTLACLEVGKSRGSGPGAHDQGACEQMPNESVDTGKAEGEI